MPRILVFLVTLLLAAGLHAQTRFGMSEPDYALAMRWLRADCLAPDAKPLRDFLISKHAAMQKAFLGALDEGPTAEEVAAVRTAAAARWRAQREFIDHRELQEAWRTLGDRTRADEHKRLADEAERQAQDRP